LLIAVLVLVILLLLLLVRGLRCYYWRKEMDEGIGDGVWTMIDNSILVEHHDGSGLGG
jgi:hypothetical protein